MPASPPTLSEPPISFPLARSQGLGNAVEVYATVDFAQWLTQLFNRVGKALGRAVAGEIAYFETTVGQAALAGAGTVALLAALAGEQWKIREILLTAAGTNFSGGGGDRLLSIGDGTTTWSVIPAATLQSLAAARWGDAGVPFPATAAHFFTASAAGTDIVAAYSGGTTDYTAGSLTLAIMAERMA